MRAAFEAPITYDAFDYSGQSMHIVNNGIGLSSGNGGTSDAATCCDAPATRDTFVCNGQSTNTVRKGFCVSCSGDSATCCEAPLPVMPSTRDTFDCNGQSMNTVHKGIFVSCYGDSGTCNATTCCDAPAIVTLSMAAVSL